MVFINCSPSGTSMTWMSSKFTPHFPLCFPFLWVNQVMYITNVAFGTNFRRLTFVSGNVMSVNPTRQADPVSLKGCGKRTL